MDLIFVFLLLSLVCTALQELIEKYLKFRSSDLEKEIGELLQATAVPKITDEERNAFIAKSLELQVEEIKALKGFLIFSSLTPEQRNTLKKQMS